MEEKKGKGYISLHFSQIHNIRNMEKEYANYYKFFKGNYYKEIPKNHKIRVLDMGCGLGETINALKKLGYEDITGVDYSQECVEFCRNYFKYGGGGKNLSRRCFAIFL